MSFKNTLITQLVLMLSLGFQSAWAADAEVTYYHNDLLGSPVAATDEAGEVIWREDYNPFGEKREASLEAENDVGYTGHQSDDDLGLVYMQARYYDPAIGRFYSNDPVGYTNANPVMSFNRYMYANNNPYKYTDPDGRFCVPCAAAVVGATVNTVAYFVTTDTSNMSASEIAAGAGRAALTGAVVGAATSVGAGQIAAAGLSTGATVASVAGTAAVIGAAGEAGSQMAASGQVTNSTAVFAAGVGNAVGAVTGGAASGPISKGIIAATSTPAKEGTGKAIVSLTGKAFPPVGSAPAVAGTAPVGAVTTLSEAAGGVAGAAVATETSKRLEEK